MADDSAVAVWPALANGTYSLRVATRAPETKDWASERDIISSTSAFSGAAIATGGRGTVAVAGLTRSGGKAVVVAAVREESAPVAVAPDTPALHAKKKVRHSKKLKVTWTESAGVSYQCRVDKALGQQRGIARLSKKRAKKAVHWTSCTSPHRVNTTKLELAKGKHRIYVRAVQHGLVDKTPSKKRFKVK